MAPSAEVANGTTFDHKAKKPSSSMNGDTAARSDHVQGPNSPVPTVKVVDFKNCNSQEELLGEIIESMRLSGGCVVRNLVTREALQEVETEVRPWLEKAEPWHGEMTLFIFVIPTLLLWTLTACLALKLYAGQLEANLRKDRFVLNPLSCCLIESSFFYLLSSPLTSPVLSFKG